MLSSCCEAFPSPSSFYICLLQRGRSQPLSRYRLCPSPSAPLQLRNFRSGEVEFVSQTGPRQSLLCLNVEEVEQKALCSLTRERIGRTPRHCQEGAMA